MYDAPAWMSAVAAVVFGIVSSGIILWQVLLMRKQGNISARLLAQQNRLIRWQHEHEWIYERNRVRWELLDLTRKMTLAASCLKGDNCETEKLHWDALHDAASELYRRLSALDQAVYSTPYDSWHNSLEDYVNAMLDTMVKNDEFCKKYGIAENTPTKSIVEAIEKIIKTANPIDMQMSMEASIRMDFWKFKQKWDESFPFDS